MKFLDFDTNTKIAIYHLEIEDQLVKEKQHICIETGKIHDDLENKYLLSDHFAKVVKESHLDNVISMYAFAMLTNVTLELNYQISLANGKTAWVNDIIVSTEEEIRGVIRIIPSPIKYRKLK